MTTAEPGARVAVLPARIDPDGPREWRLDDAHQRRRAATLVLLHGEPRDVDLVGVEAIVDAWEHVRLPSPARADWQRQLHARGVTLHDPDDLDAIRRMRTRPPTDRLRDLAAAARFFSSARRA